MKIQQNVDLQPFNTMSVPSRAQHFCIAQTLPEIQQALIWCRENEQPLQILGGGSNVILSEFIKGLVLKPNIKGREIVSSGEEGITIRLGAGESWHETVVWCLQQGFYGLENLALIPGTVGAAPVQNIGAYGADVSHFITKIEGLWLDTGTLGAAGEVFELTGKQCEFAYRESIFKKSLKGRVVITHVTLQLSSVFEGGDNLYPALEQKLQGVQNITAKVIFDAVCGIRQSKLPDPEQIPNCGSFFKNPIVSWEKYQQLEALYPKMPSFPLETDVEGGEWRRKLAAAWLIDQAGWKGKAQSGVRVHDRQALVITNPNLRPASDVVNLAEDIQSSVCELFGVLLEMEPQKIS